MSGAQLKMEPRIAGGVRGYSEVAPAREAVGEGGMGRRRAEDDFNVEGDRSPRALKP